MRQGITMGQQMVLTLIRSSLHPEESLIQAQEQDWNMLLKECVFQSVELQCFAPAKNCLEKEMLGAWEQVAKRVVYRNAIVEWEHVWLHNTLTAAKIPYVIIKGCASASYYPDPNLRAMGDVDFLVAEEDLERTRKLFENAGFVAKQGTEEIHTAFQKNGRALFEMHWQVNGIPGGVAGERIRDYLSTAIADARSKKVQMGEYMGPTDFHHGLIILLHMATHLINTGIGVRHLCDWAVFVDSFADEVFCELFEDKLRAVGLWRFARLMTQLSSVYLGVPEKSWAGNENPQLLEQMMEDIFAGGNFGCKDPERINQAKLMTDKEKGSVDQTSFGMQLIRAMNEKARLAIPAAERWPALLPVGWLYAGGRHLIRILRGRRPKIHVAEMISGAEDRRKIYQEFRLFEM